MAKNHGGKVILVVIEDMCPAAIESNRTPNLEILINTGAATMNAEANDLHLWGMLPLFGILAGRRAPGGGAFAFREDAIAEARYSISALAGTLGRSVAGYHKNARLARLRYFGIPDCLYTPQPENATGSFSRNLRRTVVSAANDIISFRPDYCLIHLGCEEHIGYRAEFMSPENLAHVAISDQELGSLLKTLSLFGLFGQYHIRVTSDLGGVVMNEAVTREETEVPWVAFGPGVKRGMTISRQLSVIDTAPTIARLMNLPSLSAWEGMAIEEILAGEGEGISLEKVA